MNESDSTTEQKQSAAGIVSENLGCTIMVLVVVLGFVALLSLPAYFMHQQKQAKIEACAHAEPAQVTECIKSVG
jgi:uncharacterized protein HemX